MLKVNRWVARAPGLTSTEDWLAWSQNPELPKTSTTLPRVHVPPAINRRASSLTRYALEVALETSQNASVDYGIFASRHGEIDHTLSLLEAIAKKEVLSPMAFSQSVHNVASGLFTIIQQSQTKVTSLCAGPETFDMALWEAHSYLKLHPKHQVLLVAFDQKLPEAYQNDLEEISVDHALGFLLSPLEGAANFKMGEVDSRWPNTLTLFRQFLQANLEGLAFSNDAQRWVPA